jgi:1-acyl-sn-glycerol-3-phosphate acyltransferase
MRARVPIVPVAVVGAEEAAPVFAQMGLLQRLTGLLYVPLTPTFPHLGPLGMLGYLPAKFKLRFLEPITFDEPDMHTDGGRVQTVAHEVRARIQENLFDMLATRDSVWMG